jgi:hypothetical protein
MGLFDKKYCDVCGAKIGLLGNRKLEDGNLCKSCAAKLSPWFSERRHSSLAEIKEQLDYREANRERVAAFRCTKTLGLSTKVLLDEDAGKFLVTTTGRLGDENPDVLDFSQVTGCDLDVRENRRELYREDSEGRQVSYSPPRYQYEYDFYVVIHVNAPYFDEIRFRLNSSSIEVQPRPGFLATSIDAKRDFAYQQCEALGNEIKAELTKVRQSVRDSAAAAGAPKTAVTCPYCGATTVPDANGCCEYCGGALGG